MGLDMWATKCKGVSEEKGDIQIADWRKHNRLHGWMTELWVNKGCPEENDSQAFNCVPLTLNKEDLEQLKTDILSKTLPETSGFFFGHDSYDWQKEDIDEEIKYDLEFVENGLKAIDDGYTVIYNSWW